MIIRQRVGPVQEQHGRFQVRPIVPVLPDGRELRGGAWIFLAVPRAGASSVPQAAEHEYGLVQLMPIARYGRGLPHIVRHIRVFLHQQADHLALERRIARDQPRQEAHPVGQAPAQDQDEYETSDAAPVSAAEQTAVQEQPRPVGEMSAQAQPDEHVRLRDVGMLVHDQQTFS